MTAPTIPIMPARTLRETVTIDGLGLFTAAHATLTIEPEHALDGFVFVRTDLDENAGIPAHIAHLSAMPVHQAFATMSARCTALSADPADENAPTVHTVEHALAALVGMGITSARLLIDGPEVPILDGSALPFCEAMFKAGSVELDREARMLRVGSDPGMDGFRVTAEAEPGYAYTIDYGDDSPIKASKASITNVGHDEFSIAAFVREVAPARTFSLRHEAEAMREAGLFEHLSFSDMLVLDRNGPVDNTLRFGDEPARHKLLDLIGDLALAGGPIGAAIEATKTGHSDNHRLAGVLASLGGP